MNERYSILLAEKRLVGDVVAENGEVNRESGR